MHATPRSRPAPRLRTARAVAAAGLVVAVGGVRAVPAGAGSSVPYDDPSVDGHIGLCDRDGHSIDHGSVADAPFVWGAVSSEAAPAPYDGEGRTATLFAFQPRKGVSPGEWSGKLLTASGHYTNPAHPRAQSTDQDGPLADYLDSYAPQWDGLVQLRIYLGAPGEPAYTRRYAATDLVVTGGTWKVVRGGDVDCHSGQSTSLEDLVPKPAAATTLAASGASTSGADAGGTPSAASADHLDGTAAASKADLPDRSSGGPIALTLLALAGAAAAIGGWFTLRRRRLQPAGVPLRTAQPDHGPTEGPR